MESIFRQVKKAFLRRSDVSIDSVVAKMHYRVTFLTLLTASLFISSKMFSNDTIMCTQNRMPQPFVDQYCLTTTTFTMDGKIKIQHSEYQWVALVLFIQAATFYFPRLVWKWTENGRISKLIQDLNNPILNRNEQIRQMVNIKQYWLKYQGTHTKLPLAYLLSEALNMANILLQIFLTNSFLGGQFLTYGSSMMDDGKNTNEKIFPTLTKCTITYLGIAGNQENSDIICMLTLNVVHQKVYFILWFWYAILTALTGINTIVKFVTTLSLMLQVKKVVGLIGQPTLTKTIFNYLNNKRRKYLQNIGDAFMLNLLLNNLDSKVTKELLIGHVCNNHNIDV